jgi:hypothetical protein
MVDSRTEVKLPTYEQDIRMKAILWWVKPQSVDSSRKGLAFKQAQVATPTI